MTVHHTGIIVKDLEKNIILYTKLGYSQITDIVDDNIQHNRIIFMQNGYHSLELIEAKDERSTIYNCKEGYHHVCYEGIENEIQLTEFNRLKIGKIFTKPIKAPAINNRNIVFACLTNGTFVEFLI